MGNQGKNVGSKGNPGWQPTDPTTLPGRTPPLSQPADYAAPVREASGGVATDIAATEAVYRLMVENHPNERHMRRSEPARPSEPELRETHPGREIDYTGRRSRTSRKITVDREWDLVVDGEVIGQIEYIMMTRETSTAGNRYVKDRWESPGWQCKLGTDNGHWAWSERGSKKECVEYLQRQAQLRKDNIARQAAGLPIRLG